MKKLMRKNMKRIVASGILFFAVSAMSHEGAHGPEQKVAPHGGVLRDGASLMLELVKEGGVIKVYPITHDGQAIDAKSVEVDTQKSSLTDAKKKSVAYNLVPEGNVLSLKFEKGSSYRYAFNLVAKFKGKENKAHWQIEMGNE